MLMFIFNHFYSKFYINFNNKIKMTNTDATAKPKIQLDFADF